MRAEVVTRMVSGQREEACGHNERTKNLIEVGISIWKDAQTDSKRELTNEIPVINKVLGKRQLCLKPGREVTASEDRKEARSP